IIGGSIDTDNGSFSMIANDTATNGVINSDRESGTASITIGDGQTINTGTGDLSMVISDGAGNTNNTAGDISFGEGSVLQTSSGNILIISENNIVDTALTGVTITSTDGNVTLVVDNAYPSYPDFGFSYLDIPLTNITSTNGKVRLFSSYRNLNIVPSVINGAPYVPASVGKSSATEQWKIYYPDTFGGDPFTLFYKIKNLLSLKGAYDFERVISESFQLWKENLWSRPVADRFYGIDREYVYFHPIYPLWPTKRFLYPVSWLRYYEY
ncbi:MAG: hypothetical protein JW769_00005, partial [Parachlamydiales bacterium]|nr:hypothetical protein [Parachlamydiales bacterium]